MRKFVTTVLMLIAFVSLAQNKLLKDKRIYINDTILQSLPFTDSSFVIYPCNFSTDIDVPNFISGVDSVKIKNLGMATFHYKGGLNLDCEVKVSRYITEMTAVDSINESRPMAVFSIIFVNFDVDWMIKLVNLTEEYYIFSYYIKKRPNKRYSFKYKGNVIACRRQL